jgi:uncharacterized protein (DUF58 family)
VAEPSVFPLVPRHRLIGLAFGAVESVRRGRGSDVAGSRLYRNGDPVQSIDWKASARLSSARGSDEFLVRERHAEEAPRVVVLVDRRPEMALYAPDSPWLCKPAAVAAAVDLIVASTRAAHGLLGYLDLAGSEEEHFWLPPRSQADAAEVARRLDAAPFDAPADGVQRGLEQLGRLRRDLPAGSFVFVVSDFLEPPPPEAWSRAQARRWELVPVVVQDPTWEQDFPAIASMVTPLADPAGGRLTYVRLSRAEVEARGAANRARRAALLAELEARELAPVLVDSADPEEILRGFVEWSDRRGTSRGRVW